MKDDAIPFQMLSAGLDDFCEVAIEWVGKAHMADDPLLEESKGPDTLGTINDLIRDDEVHGLDLRLQGTNSSEGNNTSHANVTQSGYVGTVRNFMRCKLVVDAMTSQESYVGAVVGEDGDRGCRRPPRSDGVQSSNGLETFKLAQASTANYGNVDRLCSQRLVISAKSRFRFAWTCYQRWREDQPFWRLCLWYHAVKLMIARCELGDTRQLVCG